MQFSCLLTILGLQCIGELVFSVNTWFVHWCRLLYSHLLTRSMYHPLVQKSDRRFLQFIENPRKAVSFEKVLLLTIYVRTYIATYT